MAAAILDGSIAVLEGFCSLDTFAVEVEVPTDDPDSGVFNVARWLAIPACLSALARLAP